MSTVTDGIENQVRSAQDTIDWSVRELRKRAGQGKGRGLGILIPGFVLVAMAAGVGLVIYRRRRHRPLTERLQSALPDSIREVPDSLRAQLKRPLERAARAL